MRDVRDGRDMYEDVKWRDFVDRVRDFLTVPIRQLANSSQVTPKARLATKVPEPRYVFGPNTCDRADVPWVFQLMQNAHCSQVRRHD